MREKIIKLASSCGFLLGSVGAAVAIDATEQRAKNNVDQSNDPESTKFLKKIGIGAIGLGITSFAAKALADSFAGTADTVCKLAGLLFKKK